MLPPKAFLLGRFREESGGADRLGSGDPDHSQHGHCLQGHGDQSPPGAKLLPLPAVNPTRAHVHALPPRCQEIAVQQLMAHLDSIRKDMVILEKTEFANLRSENTVPVFITPSSFV